MRSRVIKRTACVAAVLIGVGAATALFVSHRLKQSTIRDTIAWARLAPLPADATNVRLFAHRSLMASEFFLTFDAPPASVKAWLAASAGSASASVTEIVPDPGPVQIYQISPAKNARFAELRVEVFTGHVVVHVDDSVWR